MLADDHRPPLARLEVLGHQQHAVGEHVGKHVQHHLVAGPVFAFVALPRPRVGRQRPVVEPADHLVVEVLAVGLDGLLECRRRAGVELCEELLPHVRAFREQPLVVAVDLVHLPGVPGGGVGQSADSSRRPAAAGQAARRGCRVESDVEKRLQGLVRAVGAAAVAAVDQFDPRRRLEALGQFAAPGPTSRAHVVQLRRRQPAGAAARARRHDQLRPAGRLDHQRRAGRSSPPTPRRRTAPAGRRRCGRSAPARRSAASRSSR